MARGYSSVNFLGNVVRDPIFKVTNGGKAYCRFSIAVETSYKKDDKYIKATEFFNLVAWEKMAQYCEKYIKKGTRLFVVATPKNYKPQNSKYSTILFTISFLNIEGGRKLEKETETQTSLPVKAAPIPIMKEYEQNDTPRELPEDVEAIQEEIDGYNYFEEEDYTTL